MNFYFTKRIFQFSKLKNRLYVGMLILNLWLGSLIAIKWPEYLEPYLWGALLSYGYIFSLARMIELPKSKLAIALSVIRMVSVSFLIVFAGEFKLLDTCVVFCGFLSYKIVLFVEVIRQNIGITFKSGK